jgi:hypothetical protein
MNSLAFNYYVYQIQKLLFFCLDLHSLLLRDVCYGRVDRVSMMKIISNMSILYFLLCRISVFLNYGRRWMIRHNVFLRNLNIRDLYYDNMSKNRCVVYMIVSHRTKHWYVGSTTRGIPDRFSEHITLAKNKSRSVDVSLYRMMERVGFQYFTCIPVFYSCKNDIREME